MTLVAIAAVLLSALLHATWNFFNKGSPDRWAFFLGQGLMLALGYAPFALWVASYTSIPPAGWFWIGVSALTHAGYALFLLKAYDAGDLSVAYPLSRTAPVLVVVWDVLVSRGALTAGGIAGAILSGLGALLLQLPAVRAHGFISVARTPVTRYALTTAVFIALFTIVDKQGVGVTHPFLFLYFLSFGESVCIASILGRNMPRRLTSELRRNFRTIFFSGIISGFSYLLILWALTESPASYVLGLRQCSIVFGVLLGKLFLGEDTRYRLIGASIIAAGSAMIAMFG